MTRTISFDVFGRVAGQGSKRHVGKGIMVESSKHLTPWREDVKFAARQAMPRDWEPMTGAVEVIAMFYLPRPKAHFRTGKNCHELRESAPRIWCPNGVDIDKALRGTFDAMTQAGVWGDDRQIVHVDTTKKYADDRPPGAHVYAVEVA